MPDGISPITSMPRDRRSNTATAAVASSIASSGPGAAGTNRRTAKRNTSTTAANATVPRCALGRWRTNEATWPKKVSPSTETPVSLPS